MLVGRNSSDLIETSTGVHDAGYNPSEKTPLRSVSIELPFPVEEPPKLNDDGGADAQKCCGSLPEQRDFLLCLAKLGVSSVGLYNNICAVMECDEATRTQAIATLVPTGFVWTAAMMDTFCSISNMCKTNPLPCGSDSLGNLFHAVATSCTSWPAEKIKPFSQIASGSLRVAGSAVSGTLPTWEGVNLGAAQKTSHAIVSTVGGALNGVATITSDSGSKLVQAKSAKQAAQINKNNQDRVDKYGADLHERIGQLSSKIISLKEDKSLYGQEILSHKKTITSLDKQLTASHQQITTLKGSITDLNIELDKINENLTLLGKENGEFKKERDNLTKAKSELEGKLEGKEKQLLELGNLTQNLSLEIKNITTKLGTLGDKATLLQENLDSVTAELKSAKKDLKNTKMNLTGAQSLNDKLKTENQNLLAEGEQWRQEKSHLTTENGQLSKEIVRLRKLLEQQQQLSTKKGDE
jgi:hypothetical protein